MAVSVPSWANFPATGSASKNKIIHGHFSIRTDNTSIQHKLYFKIKESVYYQSFLVEVQQMSSH